MPPLLTKNHQIIDGQPLLRPQSADLLPGPEFIAWNQHNVFKTPART